MAKEFTNSQELFKNSSENYSIPKKHHLEHIKDLFISIYLVIVQKGALTKITSINYPT